MKQSLSKILIGLQLMGSYNTQKKSEDPAQTLPSPQPTTPAPPPVAPLL